MPRKGKNNSLLIGIILLLVLLGVATLCQNYQSVEGFRRYGWRRRRYGYPWWRRYYGYGQYAPWWRSYWPYGYYSNYYYY